MNTDRYLKNYWTEKSYPGQEDEDPGPAWEKAGRREGGQFGSYRSKASACLSLQARLAVEL